MSNSWAERRPKAPHVDSELRHVVYLGQSYHYDHKSMVEEFGARGEIRATELYVDEIETFPTVDEAWNDVIANTTDALQSSVTDEEWAQLEAAFRKGWDEVREDVQREDDGYGF